MIEAIEPTVVYDIPYTGLQELFVSYSSIAQLYKKILEWGLMVSQNKADSWRFETAKERYKRFLKDFPEAAKRAPISHIASYLLMTPETLDFESSASTNSATWAKNSGAKVDIFI